MAGGLIKICDNTDDIDANASCVRSYHWFLSLYTSSSTTSAASEASAASTCT